MNYCFPERNQVRESSDQRSNRTAPTFHRDASPARVASTQRERKNTAPQLSTLHGQLSTFSPLSESLPPNLACQPVPHQSTPHQSTSRHPTPVAAQDPATLSRILTVASQTSTTLISDRSCAPRFFRDSASEFLAKSRETIARSRDAPSGFPRNR